MRRRVLLLAALVIGLSLSIPRAAFAAAVTIDSQTRSVHVAIPSIVEGEAPIDETTTAPDNNPFTATLDRTLSQLEQTNHALASQDSSFGDTSDTVFTAHATGETRYSATGVTGIVASDSNFALSFTLPEDRDYSISGNGSFVDTTAGASNFSVQLSGPGGTIESFTKADFDPANNDGATVPATFSHTGTLAAGSYTLTALSGVSGGTNTTEILATYGVDFTATASGGPPPPPPAGIPLPAGAGPGLVLLAALGAWQFTRARFA